MRNVRLEICYDGTRYKGWQRQTATDNTIQGKLEAVLSRLLEQQIEVHGSGRTDAGVHALRQTVNFYCDSDMSAQEILSGLRRYLPEDIGIYSCREVSPRFHARLNAKEKTYRYRIWNSEKPCVFERRFVTVMPEKLDIAAMEAAAKELSDRIRKKLSERAENEPLNKKIINKGFELFQIGCYLLTWMCMRPSSWP